MAEAFERLEVWKRSCRLAVNTYSALNVCRDLGMKGQMTRAAVSIPSNIAEGSERGTDKEFVRFLRISKGSAAELRTQFYIAQEIGFIDLNVAAEFTEELKEISKMLEGLVRSKLKS